MIPKTSVENRKDVRLVLVETFVADEWAAYQGVRITLWSEIVKWSFLPYQYCLIKLPVHQSRLVFHLWRRQVSFPCESHAGECTHLLNSISPFLMPTFSFTYSRWSLGMATVKYSVSSSEEPYSHLAFWYSLLLAISQAISSSSFGWNPIGTVRFAISSRCRAEVSKAVSSWTDPMVAPVGWLKSAGKIIDK